MSEASNLDVDSDAGEKDGNFSWALVATRKVATSSPQQTHDDVAGIISKSRHGDVAEIPTTNKLTPQTIHRGATVNAFTEIRAISERLPSLHPTIVRLYPSIV